jgi:hypothetical protein
MSISSIYSQNTAYTNIEAGQANRIQQQISALGNALNSGNLTGANSAFAALQQLLPSSGAQTTTTTSGGASGVASPQSPLQAAMSQMQQALKSGNTSAAKSAYTQLMQAIPTQSNHRLGAARRSHESSEGAQVVNKMTGGSPPEAQSTLSVTA